MSEADVAVAAVPVIVGDVAAGVAADADADADVGVSAVTGAGHRM
jgi:hypothetical protein